MTSDYVKTIQEPQLLPNATITELMAAVLDKNTPFRFAAPGFSMMPFIRNGDMITIAAAPLRYGDVVAYINQHNNKLTVHRIIQISQAGYLLKGDNVMEPDGYFPASCIIGRVVRVEHHSRRVPVGLGLDRILIAFLSSRNWLFPVVRFAWPLIRPILGRWI